MSKKGIVQRLHIVFKCIQALSVYNMLRGGVAKSDGTWGKYR